MRWLTRAGRADERLLWSRDERFVAGLARALGQPGIIEIASGAVLIAPAETLADAAVASRAGATAYGLVPLDATRPLPERYLVALAEAVQQSGIADRVGMATSPVSALHKVMDAFVALHDRLEVRYQPLVSLATMEAVGYESLCRPFPAVGSIEGVVEAAVATGRTLDLDRAVVERVLARTPELGPRPPRLTLNVLPASLTEPWFEPAALAQRCREAGLAPSRVTIECTEQQTAPDQPALVRRVRLLRRVGFGFAIDDAGAGYASFALIAALRPSLIKIDREIVRGIRRSEARQALVEAFVGFSRRIGAQLAAEGIERTADLETVRALGVALGQGYLLGRPAPLPQPARRPRTSARASRERPATG